jgi:AcrR family transcriptional regulator
VRSNAQISPASDGKAPRTARGERTLRKILDAARGEFGERGFSDSSIVGITQRAGVALGTFYTYFDSKESVFQCEDAPFGRVALREMGKIARVPGQSVEAQQRRLAVRAGIVAIMQP